MFLPLVEAVVVVVHPSLHGAVHLALQAARCMTLSTAPVLLASWTVCPYHNPRRQLDDATCAAKLAEYGPQGGAAAAEAAAAASAAAAAAGGAAGAGAEGAAAAAAAAAVGGVLGAGSLAARRRLGRHYVALAASQLDALLGGWW